MFDYNFFSQEKHLADKDQSGAAGATGATKDPLYSDLGQAGSPAPPVSAKEGESKPSPVPKETTDNDSTVKNLPHDVENGISSVSIIWESMSQIPQCVLKSKSPAHYNVLGWLWLIFYAENSFKNLILSPQPLVPFWDQSDNMKVNGIVACDKF